jgi:hypothetical protein
MQLFGATAVGTAASLEDIRPKHWTYRVFTSAETRDAAVNRVKAAVADDAFGGFAAELWTAEPWDLPPHADA